jgi:4-hydroxy-4-methyl-2-oxoglutarate aldolase
MEGVMKPTVVRQVQRLDRAVVDSLAAYGVATVHEAQFRQGLMRPYMRPIFRPSRLGGTAITVSCHPGDNLMIHAAIEWCRPGDVLVVSTTSESTDGMFGELLGESARAHGVAGLIIDAGVRDVDALTALRFPVWSRAISAHGTVKAAAGSVNIPIVCAGTLVEPGDIVVADADGVVVVRRASASEVSRLAQQRVDKEGTSRELLKAGRLGLDLYDLRSTLAALGVHYVETLDS